MKQLFKIAAVAVLFFALNTTNAQTKLKIGHINSEELIQIMPGRDSAVKVLEAYAKDLQSTIQGMQAEIQEKYQKYQASGNSMNEIEKTAKEQELQDMQKRFEASQTSAQESYTKKQQELVAPLTEKAKKAIEDVAKENQYTYVLDTSPTVGSVLYFDKGDDLMPLVRKKLNIPANVVPTAPSMQKK